MADNDYIIFTDVSGSLLQDLDNVVYQNYDPSYIPVYGKSYKLTNYNQTTIANTFVPYASSNKLTEVDNYMTFNASNTLYITSRNVNKPSIQVYITPDDSTTQNGRFVDIGYNFGDGTDPYPYGIAFDASGILYVTMNNSRVWANVTESFILKINLTTLIGTRLIVSGTIFGNLYGCAFDNSGNFYVADYTNDQITKITMIDYNNGVGSTYANLYNGMASPTDICFDNLDNGYISNLGANNIIKVSNTNISSIFGTGLLNPYTLAYNPGNNILYVANFGVHPTYTGDPVTDVPGYLVSIVNGNTTPVPSSSGSPINPYSVAITSTGILYVTECLNLTYPPSGEPFIISADPFIIYEMVPDNVINNYINTTDTRTLSVYSVVFDMSDTYLYAGLSKRNTNNDPGVWRFLNTGITGNSGSLFYSDPDLLDGTAYSMDFDSLGNLYVLNSGVNFYSYDNTNLIHITPSGVGSLVTLSPEINGLSSIKFRSNGIMYCTDYNTGILYILTFTSTTSANSSLFSPAITGETITTPTSLVFNTDESKLYVSCYNPAKVVEINMADGVAIKYNQTGATLSTPISLAYDSTNDLLYVSSNFNIYTISTSYVVANVTIPFSTLPDRVPSLFYCEGITLNNSNSNLYIGHSVADDERYCSITTLTIDDNNLYKYTADYPTNVTSVIFDGTYTYLYASTYNNQIWKYLNTDVSNNGGFIFYSDVSVGPSLDRPTSLAFDDSENLYVGNISNDIIVITPAGVGALVVITGIPLNGPVSMKFDATYDMYVANYNTNFICKLTFATYTTANSILFSTTGEDIITPSSLSFNQTYTDLYVSCNSINKIIVVNIATGIATLYNQFGNTLSFPSGIVYDTNTNILYISNQGTNQIYMGTNDNYISIFNTIDSSLNYLSNALKLVLDSNSNIYAANYSNPTCPIAQITQNNDWLTKYNSNLLFGNLYPNAVPDRDTKNSYFYANSSDAIIPSVIYRLDYTNVLYTTLPDVDSTQNGQSMALGVSNNFGNPQKFLAILNSTTPTSLELYITFVPFTSSNSLLAETYNPTSTKINITTDTSGNFVPGCIVFANISDTINSLFISTETNSINPTQSTQFIRVDVTYVQPPALFPYSVSISSTEITINNLPVGVLVSYMAVYPVFQSGAYTEYLYIGERDGPNIYRVDISTPPVDNIYSAELYLTTGSGTGYLNGCKGLSLDDNGYLYNISTDGSNTYLYRALPNAPTPTSYIILNSSIENLIPQSRTLIFCNWDQSLIIYSQGSGQMVKYYIGFPFTGMNDVNTIGPYDDTGYIFDITLGANTYDFSFNIYTPYVVIDPSNILINTPTEVSIHFVIPFNQPEPTDSYLLLCNGTSISDIFCNNCTYNKETFLSGTYPTGLVYSNFSQYLYVALQNNTISRIDIIGVVENDFIPASAGLNGPTSLVLDASFNMFVLNAGSNYISKIILENNILDVNNGFFTGINTPICLTYDNFSNDYLYLLSGIVPNMRLTKILASDSTQNEIIGLPFGTLYNSNGLTIDEFNPGFKFLYVSDTDQNGNNRIIQISLSDGLYTHTNLITGLIYKPFTMANKNDGHLYIANKTSNNISKVSVQSILIQPIQTIQPWVSNGISVPAGLTFDGSGNLYVANSGTSPRNSRISKIYIDYYFFTNVNISSLPCNAQIYDITTKSYVIVNYYPPPGDSTAFPIPIPYPINI